VNFVKPAVKYAAVGVLYAAGPEGIWEHEIYAGLRSRYSRSALQPLREDLISMRTVGWLEIVQEADHHGQLLRKYALADDIRPFVRFQLRIDNVLAFLPGSGTRPAETADGPHSAAPGTAAAPGPAAPAGTEGQQR
jgi:hypothetical protein